MKYITKEEYDRYNISFVLVPKNEGETTTNEEELSRLNAMSGGRIPVCENLKEFVEITFYHIKYDELKHADNYFVVCQKKKDNQNREYNDVFFVESLDLARVLMSGIANKSVHMDKTNSVVAIYDKNGKELSKMDAESIANLSKRR